MLSALQRSLTADMRKAYRWLLNTCPTLGRLSRAPKPKAAGLTRFFPGSKCRRAGHLSQRMTSNGGCHACLAIHEPSLAEGESREATRQAILAWKDANQEKIRADGRKYSAEHLSESATYRRERNAKRLVAKLAARVPDPSDYTGPVISRDAAKSVGLTRFFTGLPCVNNHISQRTTINGGCFRCNSELGLQLYHEGPEERKVIPKEHAGLEESQSREGESCQSCPQGQETVG